MQWYKHDTNASSDAKMRKLLLRHGPTGYAIYFHCLELIAGNVDKDNITFELEHDAEIIADNLKVKGTNDKSGVEIVNEVMRYIVELGLFEEHDNRIFGFKLIKRLDSSMTSNPTFRKMIQKAKDNHDGVMTPSCKNRIEKNRKEENIPPKEDKPVKPKSLHPVYQCPMNKTRYETLCEEWGKQVVDSYFKKIMDYCDANGKKYKDYAAAASQWIERDIERGKGPKREVLKETELPEGMLELAMKNYE